MFEIFSIRPEVIRPELLLWHPAGLGRLDVKPDGVVNDEVSEHAGVILQLVEATELGLLGDIDPFLLIKLHIIIWGVG